MALPTSREQTFGPKPQTITAAFLNTLQDWIKNLWDGKHGAESRVIPATAAQLGGSVAIWNPGAAGELGVESSGAGTARVRIDVVRGDRITGWGAWVYEQSAGGDVNLHLVKVSAAGVRAVITTVGIAIQDQWAKVNHNPAYTVLDDELYFIEFEVTGGNSHRCSAFHFQTDRT